MNKVDKVILQLHEIEGIGWNTIQSIFLGVDDLQDVIYMETHDFIKLGIKTHRAEKLSAALRRNTLEQKLELYRRQGIGWITIFEENYPGLLRHIYKPPWALYYKGNLDAIHYHSIAVVGTRTPTAYGKKTAFEFSRQLASHGLCIVSGMAKGIDSEAHKGALSAQGCTIGVLGTGLEHIYPPENKRLYEEMAEQGLLLTEYPVGTKTAPGLFPYRNRIIAGMTLGTLVVEAAERSGSLITADLAMDESRDVFAVPGPISSPKSKGTLQLLKEGAKLVDCPQDILEEYAHMISTPKVSFAGGSGMEHDLTEQEQEIYSLLSCDPTTIDELLERSQINFGLLHSVLLSLLVKNKIAQLPSSSYITI